MHKEDLPPAITYLTVRTDWLAKAACLPGRTLHYALALLSLTNNGSSIVVPTRWTLTRYGISNDLATKALTRLTAAGLIRCERKRGCRPRIIFLDGKGNTLTLIRH